MAKYGKPPWVRRLDPAPDWAVTVTDQDGGWEIEARWWGSHGDQAGDPREVIVRQDPANPAAQPRGITSAVLRKMERLLGAMTAEVHADPVSCEAERVYRERLGLRAQAFPAGGPRSAPHDYYEALLTLFEELESISKAPIKDLAEAMGVPKETVKTRLRVARRRRKVVQDQVP